MVPSYMTTPVHVTTKEVVTCFTLCRTLLFGLPNLLPHLPLPGVPYHLLAPWVPLSWALSVVFTVLVAGRPGHASPWLAPVEGLQRFQVLAVLAAGRPDCPLPLKYPEN